MLHRIYSYPYFVLLLVGILLFFFNLGELPVSIMEARNFNVAKEMLNQGNWLLTTMNDMPRYEKPPFPAWFTTLFSQLNLNSVWLYRLPTSIMATLGIMLSYALFKEIGQSKKIALIGALVLSTSYFYMAIRFVAPSDVYTHVALIGGLLFMIKAMQHSSKIVSYGLLSIIFFAISVLSKGPVSLYAVFLPFLMAYGWVYRPSAKKIGLLFVLLILGIMLGASWYIYVRIEDPEVFLKITEKETSNWSSYKVRPFYYYWSFFIQSGIWTIPALLSLMYPYFKSKVENRKLYKFSWLWTVIAVVLLSVIPEKKSRYLVPVLFPLALNIAQIIWYQINAKKLDVLSKFALKFHYIVLLIACISVVAIPYFIEIRTTEFWIWYYLLIVLLFGITLFIFFNYNPFQLHKLFYGSILMIAIISSVGMYSIQFLKTNENYKTLEITSSDAKNWYYYEAIRPELIWESGILSKPINADENLPKGTTKVIVEKRYVPEFKHNLPNEYRILNTEILELNYFTKDGDKKHNDELMGYIFTIHN